MFGKLLSLALVATTFVYAAPLTENPDKRTMHDGMATFYATGQGACGWVSLRSSVHRILADHRLRSGTATATSSSHSIRPSTSPAVPVMTAAAIVANG